MSSESLIPKVDMEGDHPLIQALKRIDPFLIFLHKKTGQTSIPLATVGKTLPPVFATQQTLNDIQALVKLGVLQFHKRSEDSELSWKDAETTIGFPEPVHATTDEDGQASDDRIGSLHGSTKTGAKRRLKALTRALSAQQSQQQGFSEEPERNIPALSLQPIVNGDTNTTTRTRTLSSSAESSGQVTPNKSWETPEEQSHVERGTCGVDCRSELVMQGAQDAQRDLEMLLGFTTDETTSSQASSSALPTHILDSQASYAGTHPAQECVYEDLSERTLEQIPLALLKVFGLAPGMSSTRRLYRHQARAIEAALAGKHCTISTGTGSGKSLCFLLPVLAAAFEADRVSFILYPTKALAQDQLTQLQALLSKDPNLSSRIRPATLDGDTLHSSRATIAENSNVILTNPDTLHAGILPCWRHLYSKLLSRLEYVVLDEAHTYEGIFGSHVAMIMSRLVRVCVAAANLHRLPPSLPTFMAASATMPWPEELFRLLFPIAKDDPVVVLDSDQDGSPRSAKHFFVWNPPLLLASNNSSMGKVYMESGAVFPVNPSETTKSKENKRKRKNESVEDRLSKFAPMEDHELLYNNRVTRTVYRRHAADETALLLAQSLVNGVRCIAFCRTRNLVEWVYERAISTLKSHQSTAHLVDRLESYRGGYSKQERREIEGKLFRGELLGVVGTSALELGIDIGGINLTLHCGYPSSYSSLLQQSGRGGRNKQSLDVASCSVVICFNSPGEQHMWRHPKSLLSHGSISSCTIPITSSLVQAHLLCASEEFPLVRNMSVASFLGESEVPCLSDSSLFGGKKFVEAFDELRSGGCLVEEEVATSDCSSVSVYKCHFSKHRPWVRVSIRAIEPVNYAIVNVAHPGQGGRADAIHDQSAVMDTIPYSRVFYYSYPGAIIMHRGVQFKIIAMSTPPPLNTDCMGFGFRPSLFLAAFARPTRVEYCTQPLSHMRITVVKALHRVELKTATHLSAMGSCKEAGASVGDEGSDGNIDDISSLSGCGSINVKRQIHGYKKLSLITRHEISTSELKLPPLEYVHDRSRYAGETA